MIWLAIAAVLLGAACWALVLALAWPVWIAILVSLTLLCIVSVVVAFRVLRARRHGAGLERELMRQATKQADQARPERRQEILALQQQMAEAIRSLQRSKLGGRGGKAALYALPWYVILGPPAAGKTTALERSGLAFTSAGGRRHKVQGVAGTRNCDWWFSEEAILLDTAGRFATEDNDEPEWLAFLDLLKRFRAKRPLDGLIVAISATDLLAANAEQIDENAKKLRARLDELIRRLEMVLPVYVLITKADLIAGFAEFWADLPVASRGQVWGATFDPDAEALAEPGTAVKAEFDLLTRVLHARVMDRIVSERVPQRRARILQFPVEFSGVRRPLARFVDELFRPSQYQETPLFRGFYFSSGTQTGSPVDRVLAGGFGATGARPLAANRTQFEQQQAGAFSYFIADLLRRIIFVDRQLATRSKHRVRRHLRKQLVLGVIALLLTAIVVIPAAMSYLENVELIDGTAADLKLAELPAGELLKGPVALEALDRLLARVKRLDEASEQASVQYWWGPYSAPPLRASVRALYLQRLRQMVDGPLREQLSASLRSVGDLPDLDPASFKAGYDSLRLYLTLADPARLDPEWASAELAGVWSRASQRGVLAGGSQVGRHVQNYVQELGANKAWSWEEDGILVARARSRLRSGSAENIAYAELESVAKGAPPVTPDQIFLAPSSRFVRWKANLQVPGLYTALGWEKVRPLLKADRQMNFEPWVLGETASSGATWGVEQLRDGYFARYQKAWMDFFLALDVETPATLKAAIEELSVLGKEDGPYVRLFRRFAENARLELEPPTIVEQLKEKAADALEKAKGEKPEPAERKVSPVERELGRLLRFGFGDAPPARGAPAQDLPPSPLSQYLEQLRSLEVSLEQIDEAAIEPGAQFREELARTAASVERLLTGLNQTERIAIEPLLMKPIRGSQGAVEGAQGAQLNDRWRTEVWEAYRRIASRYPFVASSAYDVPLADFAEFFRPSSGTLWRFYEELLATRLLRSGNRFTPRPTEQKSGFRPDLLACLGKAQSITDGMFLGDAAQPSVPFSVKMQAVGGSDVSEITLRIDGQSLVYRNEPETWQSMQWPGKAGPPAASVQIRGASFQDQIPRDGEFGFIRLLAEGGVRPLAPGSVDLEASWDLKGGEARVVIQFRPPTATRHPFSRGFFSNFQCPAAVVSATGARR
jgi:type VI secretion system protein ImpL